MQKFGLGICLFLFGLAALLAFSYKPMVLPASSLVGMSAPVKSSPVILPPSTESRAAKSEQSQPALVSKPTATPKIAENSAQLTHPEPIRELHPESLTSTPTELAPETPKVDKDLHFPIYTSGPKNSKLVAITFDDGPHPIYTPKVLDELRKRHVKATFFVLGDLVKRYPWVVRQIMAEGHEIGNHTFDHRLMTVMSPELIEKEITETQNEIKNITGTEPILFRPPYGAFRPDTKAIFREHNLSVILWSVDPRDWRVRNEQKICNFITKQTRGGSIVLCHDIHKTTLEALPQILDSLAAEGYEFTTVSKLCGISAPMHVATAR